MDSKIMSFEEAEAIHREFKNEMLSFEEAVALHNVFRHESNDYVNQIGLESIHHSNWWVHYGWSKSLLKIVDGKKWMIIKLKHGI